MPAFTTAAAQPAGTWTAMAAFKAATVGRPCSVQINWWQASGAPSAIKAISVSSPVTDTTTGWTVASVTDTVPSDATKASLTVNIQNVAAGETHDCDNRLLAPDAPIMWTRGGLVGLTSAVITRSDGIQVRGASSANPLPLPPGTQQATVNDYEIVPGVLYTYTAEVQATV